MIFRRHIAVVVCFALCIAILAPGYVRSEPTDDALETSLEETKSLLQKSLTIYEIDREVSRLEQQEVQLGSKITQTELLIGQQETLADQTRERAGKVLRAHYMGERKYIWAMLFSAHSLSELLAVWEYVQFVVDYDQHMIKRYLDAYRKLKDEREQLLALKQEVNDIKQRFLEQRERVLALQTELDEDLRHNPEADKIVRQMDALISLWETKGIQYFELYFSSLSEAMGKLADVVEEHPDVFQRSGLRYTFTITDDQLNDFLRKQNDLFRDFSFAFAPGSIRIHGKQDDIELTIIGLYELEEEPENMLRFRVSDLVFNGFTLPDTTRTSLEEQFSLGLYPKKMAEYLIGDLAKYIFADHVKVDDHTLQFGLVFRIN